MKKFFAILSLIFAMFMSVSCGSDEDLDEIVSESGNSNSGGNSDNSSNNNDQENDNNGGTNPGNGDNGSTNPGNGDNGGTNPGNGDNGGTNPGNGDNGGTNPGNGDNGSTNPGNGDNGGTNPGNGDNGNTNPGNGDNGGTNPGNGDNGDSGDSGYNPPDNGDSGGNGGNDEPETGCTTITLGTFEAAPISDDIPAYYASYTPNTGGSASDRFGIEFNNLPAGDDDAVDGKYNLKDTNYSEEGILDLIVYEDNDTNFYFQKEGEVKISGYDSTNKVTVEFLTDVILEEVDIDFDHNYTSTPKLNGKCLKVEKNTKVQFTK